MINIQRAEGPVQTATAKLEQSQQDQSTTSTYKAKTHNYKIEALTFTHFRTNMLPANKCIYEQNMSWL